MVADGFVLIAGNDARLGQFVYGKQEERFANGHIDMHRPFPVMVSLQQGFVDEPVAEPFVFFGPHFGKGGRFLD